MHLMAEFCYSPNLRATRHRQRAREFIMTLKNSVFVEEWDGDRVARSAHDEFPVPSVSRRRNLH